MLAGSNEDKGWLGNIAIGVVGAFVGGVLYSALNDLLHAIEALEGYAMTADRDAELGEGAHQPTARQVAALVRRLGEHHRRDARDVREMLRTTIGQAAPRSVG